MAGYSAESLLAWMKNTTRMRGWDALVALDGDTVNTLMEEAHTLGISQGQAQPVPDASFTIPDTNVSHFFSGFVLGAPALTFEHSSLESPPLALALGVMGGTHAVMETVQNQNYILRMAAHGPSDALRLKLDLELGSRDMQLVVDPAQGENFLLEFPGTLTEQRKAGEVFQQALQGAGSAAPTIQLGVFSDDSNPLFRVRRIDVRAQLESPEAQGDQTNSASRKGALLLFTTLEHGATGGFPDASADFRYLIPNDADAQYSATTVISTHALHRAAFGHAVMEMFKTSQFEFIVPAEKPLAQMVAKAGTFEVAASRYQTEDLEFEADRFSVPAVSARQPLTIDFDYLQATQNWHFPCTLAFRYRALGGTEWQAETATFDVNLKHEFYLASAGSDGQGLEGQLYAPYLHDDEVSPAVGQLANVPAEVAQQASGFVAYTVKRALLEGLSRTLQSKGYERFLTHLNLGSRQNLQLQLRALPHDLAVFGQVGPGASAFVIAEQQSLVMAGASVQMTTEPARADLVWSVANAPGSGDSSPGSVSAQGVYKAPDSQAMAQDYQRVLITASDPLSGQNSTALITVQATQISVNPLIEVCSYGAQVKLSAGSVTASALEWTIKDGPGSGSLKPDPDSEHGMIYVAGPKVPNQTYVLDRITVSDGQSTGFIWVLVRQQAALLTVGIVDDDLPQGQVRLQAVVNGNVLPGVEWSLPDAMPGKVDANGIYTSSPDTHERLVVIFARFYDDIFETWFEGHIILPLPLASSSAMLQALKTTVRPYSRAQLVSRMSESPLTEGWGAVAAISRADINRQIEQQYVERHQNLTFLPLFTGDVPLDDRNVDSVRLKQAVLGVPSVAFIGTGPEVTVQMNIVAGRYSAMHKPRGGVPTVSGTFKITEPMGVVVQMKVRLLESNGYVTLNLAKASDFTCNLGGNDEAANKRFAGFFEAEFKSIPVHRGVFLLTGLDLRGGHAQSPVSFRVFTQSAPGAQIKGAGNYGDGALVLFIRLRGDRTEGRFPPSDDFPYLIPDDLRPNLREKSAVTLVLSPDALPADAQDRLALPDSFRTAGFYAFCASEEHRVGDLAVFGTLRSEQPSVTPLFSTIKAGQTQRFALHDSLGQEIPALSWEAQSLQSHTSAGHGSIDASGLYTAVSPALIGRDSLRVVVTASYEDAGNTLAVSALLNVVPLSMEVAPQMTVVAGDTQLQPVLLKGSTLDGSTVSWALRGELYGELSDSGQGTVFAPDARSGNRALVAQQIEAQGSEKKRVTVLVANGQQMLRIERDQVSWTAGNVPVQLREDVSLLPDLPRRWTVCSGPGSVDAQGLFTPPTQDWVGSTSVVTCEIVNNGIVLASGYSVIELIEGPEAPVWTELSLFTVTVPGGADDERKGEMYRNGYQQLAFKIKTLTMPVNEEGTSISAEEEARMRLVDEESGQDVPFLSPEFEGLPEDDAQLWRVPKSRNRFELAQAATPSETETLAESQIKTQDFYLITRDEAGVVTPFYARFADHIDTDRTSLQLGDLNSRITITPRSLPAFDNEHYSFTVKRIDGGPADPSPLPPADETQDDPFDFHLHTIDYWGLGVKYPLTGKVAYMERLTFLPTLEDTVNTSMILWESEQLAERMFSWTGHIFEPDSAESMSQKKIRFDENLKGVLEGVESLDIPIKNEYPVAPGTLYISLHRSDVVPYKAPLDPAREKLPAFIRVLLIDTLGNPHKLMISFLAESIMGRRNRLMVTRL
ncbi:hypothetical protein [Pseudomonas triticifolii]|uniref:Ig-like domain-containing protein n=1 Tax=Pseudomonas triticifolii TaxID=2762592 RepID=A0ABR7BAP0_9PSED|nr:hypothetical protein [Pseudomonas triticifolii]MBC3954218.1 hypothetical protein [Pseudomonas triticifolii]